MALTRENSSGVLLALCLAFTGFTWGCGDELPTEALLQKTTPSNGATAVSLTIKPQITFAAGAVVDATQPGVVLYDVTNGGKGAMAATVEVTGEELVYKLDADLKPLRQYLLEVRQGAVGGDFLLKDASDKPEETIPWKRTWWEAKDKTTEGVFNLRFSTLSHPRVTAARQDGTKIHVHFSQPMDRASCHGQIQLFESQSSKAVTVARVVWPTSSRAYLEFSTALKSTTVYMLKVGAKALGADLAFLDGNDNGKPGEKDDAFCAKFTGFQKTIFSRLGTIKRVPCP